MNPRRRLPPAGLHKQRGVVLLLFLLILVSGSSAWLLATLNQQVTRAKREQMTNLALGRAKDALIAYAATYYDANPGNFGVLPCPDVDETGAPEGDQHTNCGATHANSLGRLPWRTLGGEPIRDGSGECLWYAVSGGYKQSPQPQMLNEDSNGYLQVFGPDGVTLVAGNTPEDRAVAVIIAPGLPLANQNRTKAASTDICGGNFNPSAYLEAHPVSGVQNNVVSGTPNAIDQFVNSGNSEAGFNDKVLYITKDQLFDAIKRRSDYDDRLYFDTAPTPPPPPPPPVSLIFEVAQCVSNYLQTHNELPWPAAVNLTDYRVDGNYSGIPNTFSGRIPEALVTDPSCALAVAGEARTLWRNWKDHLFLVLSDAYKPGGVGVPCSGDCPRVNTGANQFAAIVIYSGEPLSALNQRRTEPPIDTDQKQTIGSYLEAANASNHPNPGGNSVYLKQVPATGAFNDVLYCIDDDAPTFTVTTQCI